MNCPICLDEITDFSPDGTTRAVTLPRNFGSCGHTFHAACLSKHLTTNSHCPVCRTKVELGVRFALLPPVTQAIVSRNTASLTQQLESGANTETRSAFYTPLQHAILCRNEIGVKLLLAAGANVNAPLDEDASPFVRSSGALCLASYTNFVDGVRLLIEAGASLQEQESPAGALWTGELDPSVPLATALLHDEKEVFVLLMENVPMCKQHIQTAFEVACARNMFGVAMLLADRGGEAKPWMLEDAASAGYADIVVLLVETRGELDNRFMVAAFAISVIKRRALTTSVFLEAEWDWQAAAFRYFGGHSRGAIAPLSAVRILRNRAVQREENEGMLFLRDVCQAMNDARGTDYACPTRPSGSLDAHDDFLVYESLERLQLVM